MNFFCGPGGACFSPHSLHSTRVYIFLVYGEASGSRQKRGTVYASYIFELALCKVSGESYE